MVVGSEVGFTVRLASENWIPAFAEMTFVLFLKGVFFRHARAGGHPGFFDFDMEKSQAKNALKTQLCQQP
jgi:hypothetical protein